MFKHLIVVVLVIGSYAVSGQQTPAQADTTKPKAPLKLVKKAYSMNIPTGWRIDEDCKEELCSLFSPPDTLASGYDNFVENINITVNKLSSPSYTVDQYATFSIGYLPKVVKNFKILEKKKLSATAYRLTYQGDKNYFSQTWRQYYYVKNSKVYIVTFAAHTSKYAYYQPLIEPYLNSFKLN